jgi:hypothetical protein
MPGNGLSVPAQSIPDRMKPKASQDRSRYPTPANGSVLLAITAAGLLAFGVYGIAEGAYRRITPPRLPITQ